MQIRVNAGFTATRGDVRASYTGLIKLAILVFAAYYLGTQVGLALTFRPNPIAVLWPPNAILFAALLLTRRSNWWIVVAAALPAHLLAELQGGVPLAMVLCWFVSNVCEAVIGAVCAQWLAGGSPTFDKRRDVFAFLAGGAFATLLSSFLDSAFVVLNAFGGRGYWQLWKTRVFSNATTALIVVPFAVTWFNGRIAALRLNTRLHKLEAMLLIAGLLATTALVFDVQDIMPDSPLLVYLPLPFLLWAALRFGPVGTATSIAIVAVLAIWGAGHGMGPLGSGAPENDARAVQLFVLFVAPTLLTLAATLEERRQAEEALRRSDNRFQLMLEATKDSLYDREVATNRLGWSGRSLEPLGYRSDERPATFDGWLALIHPEDQARVSEDLKKAAADGSKRWESEYRLRTRDGSYVHVHEQGLIVRDDRGAPAQIIGALTDVSERHSVAELGQRLAQASRLTAMGELTASIAHEINQPMSAILSNVDAAEMLLDTGNYRDSELREILDDIRADDVRAGEIIRHIRGLARPCESQPQYFSVRELIEGVLRLIAPMAQRRGIRLSATFVAGIAVYADRVHVQQVLLNLLLNAIDAMESLPENRRILRVDTCLRKESFAEIAVNDCGHGIPVTHLDRIFDSFYTTKKDGLGLGLSIARSLVEAHGGTIWALNNDDNGATFRFTLPTRPLAE